MRDPKAFVQPNCGISGELGRFCLPPDVVVIDNVLEITLYDYLNKSLKSGFKLGGREADYDVYWVEGKGDGSRGSQDSRFV